MRWPLRNAGTVLALSASFHMVRAAEPVFDFDALANYMHRSWTVADGLPGMVESIAQTPDGYLWLGTQHGIVRFDGERMTTFTRTATFDLRSERTTVLLVDHAGNLWVGTYGGGLTKVIENRVVRTYSIADGLSSEFITALMEDHHGGLWIGQKNGAMSRLVDGAISESIVPHDTRTSFPVRAIHEGRNGHILIADESGVADLQSPGTRPCTFRNGSQPSGAISLSEDGPDEILIGSGNGLYRCRRGNVTDIRPRNFTRDFAVSSIKRDKTGDLWMATSAGVMRLRNGRLESFREKDGLSADVVRALFIDSVGDVWAGTMGGLDLLRGRFITSYAKKQGLSSDQVWSVAEGRSGQIWVGTNGGLDRIVGSTVQTVLSTSLPSRTVYSTEEGPDGSLWFATAGGVGRLNKGHLSRYGRKDGLPGDSVKAIAWTRTRGLLVSPSHGGLFTFSNGKFQQYLQFAQTVHSISEGRDGSLWLSTTGPLLHVENGHISSYGGPSDDFAYSLEDAAGRVWAGAWLHGLLCVRGGKLVRFDSLGRPFDDHIFHIFQDGGRNLWLATPHGLFRVSEEELEQYMSGTRKHVTSDEFGMDDGFPSTGCNGSEQNSGFTDRKGRFWVPTGRGLAVVDPSRVKTSTIRPSAVVEHVTVDDRSFAPIGVIVVPSETRRIVFTYTGISLAAPHEVRFRYRLEGYDKVWTDAGTARSVSYTGLRAGSFSFRVVATNRFGVTSESAPVRLTVTEPFYRSDLFFVSCGVMVVCAAVVAYRWRIAGIRARNRVALTERTRMAREIHDTLLQGVAGASLLLESVAFSVQDGDARRKFRRALDEMQIAMSETRCALFEMRATDEQASSLTTRISQHAQTLSRVAGIRFTFELHGDAPTLDPDVDRQIFKMVREAILNAIKHSRAEELDVTGDFRGEAFRITVRDNGRGFDNANPNSGEHWGLVGMRERAESLGGSCTVLSTPGEGTSVVIEMPRRAVLRRRPLKVVPQEV